MKSSTKMTEGGRINRTGMSTSSHADRMREVTDMTHPAKHDGELKAVHAAYARDTHALGTVPPPTTLKGAATAAKQMLKGNKATALIDKIAERLAFERTGVRLYDALIDKLDVAGTFDGGPQRDQLTTIRGEELAHAHMLIECLEEIGADPTAVTPSADLAGVEAQGLGTVLGDPRTTLAQGLHALLVAELADNEGWTLLRSIAEELGQKDMARRFQQAEQDEERHLAWVRSWVTAHAESEAELI
jgi:rubrerythrin